MKRRQLKISYKTHEEDQDLQITMNEDLYINLSTILLVPVGY